MNIDSNTIREARLNRGWTQQQLSEVSCLSLRTIQRVESQGQGSLETCNALCAVLELDRQQVLQQTVTKSTTTQQPPIVLALAVICGFVIGVLATLAFI
ncbi:helix-turn-helix transcriptional regulator [Alishewanella sp. d11]|uniref:helix-turn-helix transcriptional regulator n=1 Tax=Alishewanella sp. d11 TaxID=3414030 RepID=UPI003BF91362